MSNGYKRVELISNIAIIVVAVLLGVILILKMFEKPNAATAPVPQGEQLEAGMILPTSITDWSRSDRNLVLVLSTTCGFCNQSAPFYNRLTEKSSQSAKIRTIAVFPQETKEAADYLAEKKILADEVLSFDLGELNVRGTPTVILLNKDGVVLDKWVGKLPENKEAEVMTRVFSDL